MITFLSLGTNLGDKEANIEHCLQLLQQRVGTLLARSSYYYSEPQGFVSRNNFVNIVAKFSTELSPFDLLSVTQAIERDMGRTEKSYRVDELEGCGVVYHDRIIDIDILLYDELVLQTPVLTIPHPRMKERDFVIIPLNEVILSQIHP